MGTTSLLGHAAEVQISRWGLPLLTHLFVDDPSHHELGDRFDRVAPADDVALFGPYIAEFAERMTRYAASADPAAHGRELAARLCPATLPTASAREPHSPLPDSTDVR